MADITPLRRTRRRPPHEAEPDDGDRERLVHCVELLFFAYRDFTADPDQILETYGFGRAHHRVLHFVHRNPGLRVTHLLEILKITKQSLSRVLRDLLAKNVIVQKPGPQDRRERLLFATPKGARLADKLTALQTARVGGALAAAGDAADGVVRDFFLAMISEEDRPRVRAMLRLPSRDDKTLA